MVLNGTKYQLMMFLGIKNIFIVIFTMLKIIKLLYLVIKEIKIKYLVMLLAARRSHPWSFRPGEPGPT